MKKICLLLLCLSVLPACEKRYEDGPCLSFIKAENRICGKWAIAEADTQNVMIDGSGADTLSCYHFSFVMNSHKAMFLSVSDTTGTIIAESFVRTDERLTSLSFCLQTINGYDAVTSPLFHIFPALEFDQVWAITRLKRREMCLQTDWQGSTHKLKFELVYDYQSL